MHLLLDELVTLSRTPYFSKSLGEYLDNLILAVRRVLEEFDKLPPDVTESVARLIWLATKYLHGGTSKSVPYETVYALKLALEDWVSHPCAITTALLDDLDYHFWGVDPGQILEEFVPGLDFKTELIQIALPKLYRHYPLYNVALYHELGHYVDKKCGVTSLSLLTHPPVSGQDEDAVESHRKEYFADLFAASYTGKSIGLFLDAIAHDAEDSSSHPATSKRISVVNDYLEGKQSDLLDMYQSVLDKRGLPKLQKMFVCPDIEDSFNSIRTYSIKNNEELHGIIEAGWVLLYGAYKQNMKPWKDIDKNEIMRILNDLIEKSIRNRMIKMKWENAITDGK
ncbi:MAG: hypothetical protein ABW158_10650 [Candidatus Thiodiazotropha sp. 6PDIVS]